MPRGTFRLKSRELLQKYGEGKSLYRVAKDGDVAYSTIHRWTDTPGDVEGIRGDILFGFLMGLGLSLEEIKQLPLGEVFDFEPEENGAA